MAETITVELTFATAEDAQSERLQLPADATVADALAASRFATVAAAALAIHGQTVQPTRTLQDGDRIDLLRTLLIDPMEARRRRAAPTRKQRATRQRNRTQK